LQKIYIDDDLLKFGLVSVPDKSLNYEESLLNTTSNGFDCIVFTPEIIDLSAFNVSKFKAYTAFPTHLFS